MELNQDLVEEGKALVGKTEAAERMTCEARFALGRWAQKIVPVGTGLGGDRSAPPVGGGATEPIFAYAEAIGMSGETLKSYRDITVLWEGDDSTGLSWAVVKKLAYRSDRVSLIANIYNMFGKVTTNTIANYETHMREENARREALLQPQFTDEVIEGDEDWDESQQETEIEFVYDPVNPPINIQPRKHGYSGPIRKLFAVVEHCRAAKAIFMEESIPSVDYANDEYFEEIMNAFDTIITEMMDYREQVVAKRVKAGLSPEVAS